MAKPLINLWTVQLARHRLVKQMEIELVDITAGSGNKALAPEFTHVMQYKRGEMGEREYTERYRSKMRQSLIQTPHHWARFKELPRVAVACYCASGVFCHRHLFADMLKKYLEREGSTVLLRGEILPTSDVTIGGK